MFAETGDATGLGLQLDDLGDLAMREGDPARALLFGGAAAGLRVQVAGGAPPSLTRHGDYIADARAALGPAAADAAWEAGMAMDQATAVGRARELFGRPGAAGPDRGPRRMSGTRSGPRGGRDPSDRDRDVPLHGHRGLDRAPRPARHGAL